MHGDGFEVDPERLASRAAQFEPLAGRLDDIHRNLADALSTDGACWGTDAVGQSFSAVHADSADDAVARLSALSERLGSVGTRLSATANTYRAVDQSAIEHLDAAEQ
jgi:uncharacterized protein YukE